MISKPAAGRGEVLIGEVTLSSIIYMLCAEGVLRAGGTFGISRIRAG